MALLTAQRRRRSPMCEYPSRHGVGAPLPRRSPPRDGVTGLLDDADEGVVVLVSEVGLERIDRGEVVGERPTCEVGVALAVGCDAGGPVGVATAEEGAPPGRAGAPHLEGEAV